MTIALDAAIPVYMALLATLNCCMLYLLLKGQG